LALDIGGANLKAAHTDGSIRAIPFEVWKRPGELGPAIGELAEGFPPFERVAVTMTAELCDCFPTKSVGVNAILDAVKLGLPDRPVSIWGIDGRIHEVEEIRQHYELAAAANWMAQAIAAARLAPCERALLIDIGSTTTDLIPLDRGRVAAQGRNDTERLQTGELVYAGVRRTPVCALATQLPFRGKPTGLAAELFAMTLDVFLTLGDLDDDSADVATADVRPATIDASRDRLARMVGADRQTFSPEDALALARSAADCLTLRLEEAALRACETTIGQPKVAIVSGSGEFLARRLARQVVGSEGQIIGLAEAWGPAASKAGCAYALVLLAEDWSVS
jgi:probable H4MPT-linked C1 transfer pathway protein